MSTTGGRVRSASARANVLEKDSIVLWRRPASATPRAGPRTSPIASPRASAIPSAVSGTEDSLYNNLDSLLGISDGIHNEYFREALKQSINARKDREHLLTLVKENIEKYTNMINLVQLFDKNGDIFNMANNMINNRDKSKSSTLSWKLRKELRDFNIALQNRKIIGYIFSLDNFLRFHSNYDNVCKIILNQLIKFDSINMKKEKEEISKEAWKTITNIHGPSELRDLKSELRDLKVKEINYLVSLIIDIICIKIFNSIIKRDQLNSDMIDIINLGNLAKEVPLSTILKLLCK